MTSFEKEIIRLCGVRASAASVFIALMFIMSACRHADKQNDVAPVQNVREAQLVQVNNEIKSAHQNIDSLRTSVQSRSRDALLSHPAYKYVSDNAARIDSLCEANKDLIEDAHDIVVSNSVMDIPKCDAYIFKNYKHIPAVKRIGNKYIKNAKEIAEYQKVKKNLITLQFEAYRVIDKMTIEEVRLLQLKLDSLLNAKDAIISRQR